MYKCDQCPSVFSAKRNLIAHQKNHAGVRFPCTACSKTFSYKNNLNKHQKNIHDIVPIHLRPLTAAPIVDQPARPSVIRFASRIVDPDIAAGDSNMVSNDDTCIIIDDEDTGIVRARPLQRGEIEIASDIIASDIPAGPSNELQHQSNMPNHEYDDMCVAVLENAQSAGLCDAPDSYMTSVGGKRVSTANTVSAVKAKKARMELVTSPGLVEISSSGKRKIVWYFSKNLNNIRNYPDFLRSLEPALSDKLKTHVQGHPIKFSLSPKSTS